MRAKDLGDKFPSDSDDSIPDDPILGRQEEEYTIIVDELPSVGGISSGSQLTPGRNSTKATNLQPAQSIEIRTTRVFDEAFFQNEATDDETKQSVLGSLCDLFDRKLVIHLLGYLSDPDRENVIAQLKTLLAIVQTGTEEYSAGVRFDSQYVDTEDDAHGQQILIYDTVSGEVRPEAMIPVRVWQRDGSAGDATNLCTFGYEVQNLRGVILADSANTPIQPIMPRETGAKIAAPAGSIGFGYWNAETREFYLVKVGEIDARRICTPP